MPETASVPAPRGRIWPGPLAGVLVALGWTGLAALLRLLGSNPFQVACLPLVGAGLLVAAWAVRRALYRFREDFDTRLEAAAILGLATLVPLLGFAAMERAWDSGRMLMTALVAVGIAGTLLVMMPRLPRLAVISVLILLHFGGMVTCALNVDPPGRSAPLLSNWAWVYFYRPYVGFMYLGNAYHFYSPDPGPPTLVWSSVIYSKGDDFKYKWVKIPDREQSPVPLHHQRLLALTESTNQIFPAVTDEYLQLKVNLRKEAKEMHFHPGFPVAKQLQLPAPYSQEMVKAVARHMARLHPFLENDPEYKFHSVKVYRVIHGILDPQHLAQGISPLDKTFYFPYYQGEFDEKGDLKDPDDPLLYWLIPIYRPNAKINPDNPDENVVDLLEDHARTVK